MNLSVKQISEFSELDRDTVADRLKHITPTIEGKTKLYPARQALLAVFEMSTEEIRKQQLRYETGRAARIEMQNAKMQGELVSVEDVAGTVEKEYGAVRAGLLAIPSKCAIELAALSKPIEIKNRLADLIDEVLEELTADKN